jgi:uncharacterized protein (TIGR03437 family)
MRFEGCFSNSGARLVLRIAGCVTAIALLNFGDTSKLSAQTTTCRGYGLSPNSALLPAQGGSGTFSFNLSGNNGCSLQPIPSQSWITATLSLKGAGGGVTYSVAANPGKTARTGFILVGSTALTDGTFFISQDGTSPPAALPGDSLVVGSMSISTYSQITQNLPQPVFANQKFCGPVQLAPGLFVEAYVPTAAERFGNFSSFSGLLVDPITANPEGFVGAQPFPAGIIPASRLSDPWPWRTSSGSGSSSPGCMKFPFTFIPYSLVYYITPQLGDNTISITSANPNPIVVGSGAFTMTLRGRGFLLAPDIRVQFNGNALIPSSNNGVELTVSVPGNLTTGASPSAYSVAVTSAERGLTSNTFQIRATTAPGPFLSVNTASNLPELHLSVTKGVPQTAAFGVTSASTLSVQTSIMQITPTSQKWLSVSPVSAITPATFTVSINTAGLAPGTYTALVTLTGTLSQLGAIAPALQAITDMKTLVVVANVGGQTINLAPPSISFSYVRRIGLNPPPQTMAFVPFNLSDLPNGAPHTFTASVLPGAPWLSIDAKSAQNLPGSINVSVDPSNLAAGTYPGQIAAVPDNIQGSSVNVDVTLIVRDAPDTQIGFPPFPVGGPLPDPQMVPLTTDTDQAGFFADLVSEMNWLQLSPQRGQTPQTLQFSVDPSAAALPAGSHLGFVTINDQNNPGNIAIFEAVLSISPPPPVITMVKNAGSEEPFISPNLFVEIKGSNLANSTMPWTGAPDFQAGNLPTMIGNVSVMVNGKPGYVSYISPGQINVLAPVASSGASTATIVVNNNGTMSAPFIVPMRTIAPALFEFDLGTMRVAATHADNTPVAPVGTYPGSYPAAPGETIQVWGAGFGDTVNPIPDGRVLSAPSMLKSSVTVSVDGANADVPFAGLVAAGLYQINVTVPLSARDGDLSIKASTQGAQTLDGIILAVHH